MVKKGYVLPFAVAFFLMIDHAVTINHFPRIYHYQCYYPDQHINRHQYGIPEEDNATAVGPSRSKQGLTAEQAAELQRMRMKNLLGMEQELLVMLNIDSKWEQYLLPGPMAVATLGQLVVISTKRDFKLENVNVGKSTYLRHTHFRPALIQVVNVGLMAFRLANRNMERIKLSMAELPRNVKQALRFLGSPKPEIISKFLPIPLDAIEQTSKECVQYAIEIDDIFLKMIELLFEVDEALAATHGYYREGIMNLTREKEIAEANRQFLEKIHEQATKEFEKVSKQLDQDRATYEKALKNIPTGWNAVFQDMVRSINPMQIAGTLIGSGGALGSILGGLAGSTRDGPMGIRGSGSGILRGAIQWLTNGKFKKTRSDNPLPADGVFVSDHNLNQEHALNHAENVFRAVNSIISELRQFFDVFDHNGAHDTKTKKQRNRLIGFLTAKKLGAVALKETLSPKGDSPWKAPTMKLLNQFVDTTSLVISELAESEEGSLESQEAIRNKVATFNSLRKDGASLVSVRSYRSGTISSRQILSQKAPSGKRKETGSEERFIAAQRQATLLETQHRYDVFYDRVIKENKELKQVMRRLSNLNMEKINFKQIRQILQEGISAIASLKKQFDRLIRFFQIISVVASVTLKKAADGFLLKARELGYDSENAASFLRDDPTLSIRDAIVADATRIATVSRFLFTLSNVYVTISNRYIIDNLATASGLQTVDEHQMSAKLKELLDESEASQAKILKIVDEKRKEFKRAVAKSNSEIEKIFRSLGKPTKDEINAIESARTVVGIQVMQERSKYTTSCLGNCEY